MSFSNPTITNPAKKFFKWKGGPGEIVWYDRDNEKELKVSLINDDGTYVKPFRFILLDELTTIKGYDDTSESGIWSNEVRSLKKDVLNVKSKGGDIVSGTYEVIKDTIKAKGGKFARSLYIAYQEPDGEDSIWEVGNLNLAGGSVGEWFEFRKKSDLQVEGAVITGIHKVKKKGGIEFFVPVFETWQFKPSDIDAGKELDQKVQKYLETYLAGRGEDKWRDQVETQGLDKPEDTVLEDIDDKPIDLSEIPF
ncbi:hypothetical protein DVS77_21645 [Mycolicibacterium moriokaense]|nr:hypothetical protein DVS77_21645 [Mycolicibacterium moriokaense]